MSTFAKLFDDRVEEIEAYFHFLELTIGTSAKIYRPGKQSWRYRPISDQLEKILKATGFLILYNFVESMLKASIEEISSSINSRNLCANELSTAIRKLWVQQRFRSEQGDFFSTERFPQLAFELVEDVLNGSSITFSHRKFRVSGNVDAAHVRDIARALGLTLKVHHRSKGGEKLELVKRMRNSLAHGSLSFAECGRDFTLTQLKEIKNEVIIYMRWVKKSIEAYISSESYKS
jgi:hypothetical protein